MSPKLIPGYLEHTGGHGVANNAPPVHSVEVAEPRITYHTYRPPVYGSEGRQTHLLQLLHIAHHQGVVEEESLAPGVANEEEIVRLRRCWQMK